MYGLRTGRTIRAAAPDRFRNDGNDARPQGRATRDARCIGRLAASKTGGGLPQRRRAPACLWRQRAFSHGDYWHRPPVRVKYRAFWNGSARVARADGPPGELAAARTPGKTRNGRLWKGRRTATAPKQSAASSGQRIFVRLEWRRPRAAAVAARRRRGDGKSGET